MHGASYQSSGASTDKFQGRRTNQEKNAVYQQNNYGLRHSDEYEEEVSYEEVKGEEDYNEEELPEENTSRELSPHPQLETSTLSNESPPKNETRTPEPHRSTPENERKKLFTSQLQPNGEDSWQRVLNFEQDKKRIEMTLESMKQKHEESKRALQRFKLEKFFSKLEVILVKKFYKYLKIGFSSLSYYSIQLEVKLQKQYKRTKLLCKKRFFYAWKAVHEEGEFERQRIKEESEVQRENDLYEKAVAFYDWVLLNKYFMEGFVKHHRHAKREKQFQESQSVIKKKVNSFISALKDKAVEIEQQQLQQQYSTGVFPNIEQEQPVTRVEPNNKALRNITNNSDKKQRIEKQKNLAQQSYMSKRETAQLAARNVSKVNDSFGAESKSTVQTDETFETEQEEYEEEKLVQQPEKLRNNSKIASPIKTNPSMIKNSATSEASEQNRARRKSPIRNQVERNDLSQDSRTSEISERSESRDRSNNAKRANPVKHTNEVLEKIEQRAKERKEKTLEAKKKRVEEKKQKDLEKLRRKDKELEELRHKRLEEKQLMEKKRREEAEKREKVEKERKDGELKLNKALNFHKRKIMEIYGLKPWKTLLEFLKVQKEQAVDHFLYGITKRTFKLWKEGVRVIKSEKERIMQEKMEKAAAHHSIVVMKKTYNRFVKYLEESLQQKETLEVHRIEFLKRSSFKAWYLSLSALRKENIEVEERYNKICNRFRFITLGEKALTVWKNYCLEEKKERLKKGHKEQMWSKVNMILNEYQQKKKK